MGSFAAVKKTVTSPWFSLVFLIFPLALLAQRLLGQPLMEPRIVLFNVILFLCYLLFLISVRFLNRKNVLKYGRAKPLLSRTVHSLLPASGIRTELRSQGYVLCEEGTYGEAPDRGYNWGTVFLAGVILTLGTGSFDNLRQLSGTLHLSIGEPIKLYQGNSYVGLATGPFAGLEDLPFQLQIRKQYQPSEQWRDGAAEVAILDRDGKELVQGPIAPDKPLLFDAFRVFTTGFVYEPWVVIITADDHLVYGGWIKLRHDKSAGSPYRFSNVFSDAAMNVSGRGWYDPDNDRLKLEAWKDEKQIVDVVLGMGAEHRKKSPGYVTTLLGVGKWTEIHFVRKRHPVVLLFGAAMTLVGGIFRLLYRPKRVWIEERGEGWSVRTTDRKVAEFLKK